ncbi:hypothetical protein LEP1GSC040_2164 [Leptospira santarosai str. 2000030832]|nr:hypothetical protein LEP1GSC040_2164 [Leptospira santarosai str. 2000030832]
MNLALQIPNFELPKQSDRTVSTWSEICIFNQWNSNLNHNLTLLSPEAQSKKTKMKILLISTE